MEFISYFCESKDGLEWQWTTLSLHGVTARVRPVLLYETKHWLLVAIIAYRVCNGRNS